MEIMTSWMEEGLQQGEQSLVLRQLTHRFGVLPAAFQARISGLSIERLEQLGEALLDFSALADLTNWLDQHARTEDAP